MTTTTSRPPTKFGAMFQWRSLKTRVTLCTLTSFLIGIWSLAFYAGYTLQNDMENALGKQQFATVSIIASDINDELDARLKMLELIAAKITPALLGNAASMQTFLESHIFFERLFNYGGNVLRPDGIAIADVPVSGRIGVNYSDRDWMIEALTGKTAIGKPVIGKTLHLPAFIMATPVRDAKGAALSDTDQPPQPLPITRQDEIGELIGGFNHLLAILGQRGEALRESELILRNLLTERSNRT